MEPQKEEGHLKGKKILVVDDEVVFLECFRSILESEGAIIKTAESGEEALKLLETESFDLITTGLAMPGMGGISLCRAIREENITTPIVVITGCDYYYEAMMDINPYAVCDFIFKPWEFNDLKRRLGKALASTHADKLKDEVKSMEIKSLNHSKKQSSNSDNSITILLPFYNINIAELCKILGFNTIWAPTLHELASLILSAPEIDLALEWQWGPRDFPVRNLLRGLQLNIPIFLMLNWNREKPQDFDELGYADTISLPNQINEMAEKFHNVLSPSKRETFKNLPIGKFAKASVQEAINI